MTDAEDKKRLTCTLSIDGLSTDNTVVTGFECVEELYADHLVLGAHGHGALQEFLLGSVARDVQKRARVPVTTLRALESDKE